MSVNVQNPMVGCPGLDPGTLRVFPERPWTSVSVQICWPCPLTSYLVAKARWFRNGPASLGRSDSLVTLFV